MSGDLRRARNLRGLAWLRLAGTVPGFVFGLGVGPPGLPLPYAAALVAGAVGFVVLAYRSPWYTRRGWFDIGFYDFIAAALTLAPFGSAAIAVLAVMVLLSALMHDSRAPIGATVLSIAVAAYLFRDLRIAIAAPILVGCGAGAYLATRALRRALPREPSGERQDHRRRPSESISLR